ncbi:MAG: hypothetical protein M1816_001114 [Peltula sp. TS41687]|nr:MAG: hypothetical protein M1816_001114 [Peltula sp. TS41687]
MATNTPPFTIRNISCTPLTIKLVERYIPPPQTENRSPFVSLLKTTQSFTGLKLNATSTAVHDPNTPPSTSKTVSVPIAPFQTCTTTIPAPNPSAHERVRLTLSLLDGGEAHTIDTPSPTNASTVSHPLTPSPKHSYTAIYLPSSTHLTLFSSADLPNWMRGLPDPTPLSALSMPGTHNSPTHHHALPSVQCQAATIPAQLANGIRFLDVRVQPESPDDPAADGLVLVHGAFPVSLRGKRYLRPLLDEVCAFLDAHPTETVVVSIKREGPGTHTDAQLARRLREHYVAKDAARWFTEPRIPALGEARRKLVLLRRFALDEEGRRQHGGLGWGVDAETWRYNTPSDTCPSGDVCVQDFCEVMESENIEAKIRYCEAQLGRAGANVTRVDVPPPAGVDVQRSPQQEQQPVVKRPFYINFLSGSNFWNVQTWPERIAQKLNPAIVEYLCRRHGTEQEEGAGAGAGAGAPAGDWSTGIVVCDWVGKDGDWDLIRCIVGMNARLESKLSGAVHAVTAAT